MALVFSNGPPADCMSVTGKPTIKTAWEFYHSKEAMSTLESSLTTNAKATVITNGPTTVSLKAGGTRTNNMGWECILVPNQARLSLVCGRWASESSGSVLKSVIKYAINSLTTLHSTRCRTCSLATPTLTFRIQT